MCIPVVHDLGLSSNILSYHGYHLPGHHSGQRGWKYLEHRNQLKTTMTDFFAPIVKAE